MAANREQAVQPEASVSESVRLKVEDLRIILAGNKADVVSEVSFAVRSGKLLGLVGESGSGKTTVALALLGYSRRGLEIASGTVELDGQNLLKLEPSRLRALRGSQVAYVPQDPASALSPGLRVRNQLEEVLQAHPGRVAETAEDRILNVLGEVGLDPHSDVLTRYPHQLSGGQQQRVAIAMAFICRPSLIVLDEPTTGLDVTTQRRVLETVRTMCRSYGAAGVYVSHDLAVVGQLVDDVAVMYAGKLMEMGDTEPVLRQPIHPYTRGLLAAIPSPDRAAVLVGIEGRPPSPERSQPGCPFEPRCPVRLDVCRTELPTVTLPNRLVRCVRAVEVARTAEVMRTPAVPAAPAPADTLLSIRDVAARYGKHAVLEAIDLDVPRTHCVALVGESGSGKTTLARCIVGLHHDWSGEIVCDGRPLGKGPRERSDEDLRRIKYVFQNPYTSLNPRKTVEQILEQPLDHFFRLGKSERQDRIARALEDVSLGTEFARRYPDQLSGGQRQRLAIARGLIVEPELLVCDEVTSALDVSVQAVVVELIRSLQLERRLSVLFITHNLALVRSIAQTCAVMADGRIVEAGKVEDVLERPTHPYTVRLMDDVPRFGAHLATGASAV